MNASPPKDLSAFIKTCTLSMHSDSVSDALVHLQSGKIPDLHSNSLADIEAIKQAIGSLLLLRFVMISSAINRHLPIGPGVAPDLIHSAWQDIWRWIVFLHTHCVIKQARGEIVMQASLWTIPVTLMSFGWHSGLRLSLIRTPGMISMPLARQWLKADTHPKQLDERHFSDALEQLLTYQGADKDTDEEVIAAIVHSTEGGEAVVTRVALQQFGAMLQFQRIDFDVLSLFLTLIHNISSSHPILRPSLLYQGLIPLIASFLRQLPTLASDGDPVVDRCIYMAYTNLVIFTQTINGPSFIVHGLDKGLLAAFVTSWPLMQQASPELSSSTAIHFFAVLKDYLVYRSVLRSLAKALKEIKRIGVLALDCKPWETFQTFALRRLAVKDEFDEQSESRLDPGFFGCANHNVSEKINVLYAVWTINPCHSAGCDPMMLITSFVLGATMICIVTPLVRRTIGRTTGLSVNRGKSLCVVCILYFQFLQFVG
jgi:hypothetical protein